MDVVVTSFLDSAVGRAAALHCAASLPEPLRACGLATGSLLACDLAVLEPEHGSLAAAERARASASPPIPISSARVASGPRRGLGP